MPRPELVQETDVARWLTAHTQWKRDEQTITRSFEFADFSAALAFVVRVGLAAEKHDHHPDIELGWGRASVSWTTHEPKGLTTLDLALAEACDQLV